MAQSKKPRSNSTDRYLSNVSKSGIVKNIDELKSLGRPQGKVINLVLKNETPEDEPDKDILIVFGTPLGISETYENVPVYDSLSNHFLDNQDYIVDNQGAGANFIQLLNRRFCRFPVLFKGMEIILPAETDANLLQATQPIEKVFVPYNSANDSQKVTGSYVSRDTDNNYAQILDEVVPVGEFVGIVYKLHTGASVNINIELAGHSETLMKLL